MIHHKTYTSLYEPIYLFNVPPRFFVREVLATLLFFFLLTVILNIFMEMILSLGISFIFCLFGFFFVHSFVSGKYKRRGFYWKEEEKFYDEIPYKKVYKKNKAFLP